MDHFIKPFKVWFKGFIIDLIIWLFGSEEYCHNNTPGIIFLELYWAINPWDNVYGEMYCALDGSSANVAGFPITIFSIGIPRVIS